MGKLEQLLTDLEIDVAWGNANFGASVTRREVIRNSLLKYACGYGTGHTAKIICQELQLIGKNCTLTKRGKEYLWYAYYNNQFNSPSIRKV